MTTPIQTGVRKGRGVPAAAAVHLGRALPTEGRGAAVLCYHDIGRDPTNRTDYYVSPERFRDHLRWIRDWGMTIVPLAEIVDRLALGRDLDGLAAITFDDALLGVHEYAGAILHDLNVPATVFVVSDVLGEDPAFWPGAARTMTAAELGDLTDSGLVGIGSHTKTHVSLPAAATDVRRAELIESRTALAEIADSPVDLVAYPSGHHDLDTERASAAAGYRAGFTFRFGRVTPTTDPLAIPRFCMGPDHDRFRLARQLARPVRSW